MMLKAVALWIIGILLLLPYSLYRAFTLEFSDYIFWLFFSLLWLLAYWPLATPLITLLKIRNIYRFILKDPSNWRNLLDDEATADTAIEFIAQQSNVPEFIARKVYEKISVQLKTTSANHTEGKTLAGKVLVDPGTTKLPPTK